MIVRVGNDVVDLEDPQIDGAEQRPRLLARICAESERTLIAASAEPKTLLWSLFAAKEAAYKVVCKLGPRPVFAHRQFVVARDLRSVQWGVQTFPLWIDAGAGWVHARVASEGERPLGAVETLAAGADPGAAARALLLRELDLRGVEVIRDPVAESWDGFGPPRLSSDATRDISLSHDGRFVAYAAAR